MRSKYKINDWVGKIVNNWKILSYSHLDSKHVQYWICECRCGRQQPVRTTFLMKEKSKNCTFCRNQAYGLTTSPYWKGGDFISSTLYTVYKLSANKRNIIFDISIDDLEEVWCSQLGRCVYTDTKLTLPIRNRDKNYNASLDRIDSSKGYVKGNIQWVMKEINFMKITLTSDKFIELCKLVSNHAYYKERRSRFFDKKNRNNKT